MDSLAVSVSENANNCLTQTKSFLEQQHTNAEATTLALTSLRSDWLALLQTYEGEHQAQLTTVEKELGQKAQAIEEVSIDG